MARSRQQTIPVEDVVIDEALYPRKGINPLHVTRLIEVINAGATLPPILIEQGTNRLVDGAHRLEAFKRREMTHIPFEARVYSSEADLFAEAVRLNAEHGVPLTSYDLKEAIRRLSQMGYTKDQISGAVRMTVQKIEDLQKGFASDTTGQPIALKGGLSHKRGQTLTPQQTQTIRRYGGGQAVFYTNQLIMLLENDLWPHENIAAKTQMDKLARLWLTLYPSVEDAA